MALVLQGVQGHLARTGGSDCWVRGLIVSGRRRRACALASVRRPNCTYGFPVCSVHEDSATPGCKRRNEIDQPNKPVLVVELRRWQPFPARITPAPVPMRPNASPDPAVETLEELADVGAFVILAPTPQEWI